MKGGVSMKITLIGSHLCQDTLYALMKLKEEGAEIEFKNISVDFSALKTYVKLREHNTLYDIVKKNDGIGIPVFLCEDGTETLDLGKVLKKL